MQLDRIMMVLEYVAAADRPVSATELHKLTEIPKPTCYRALLKLAENGFNNKFNNQFMVSQIIH